MLDVTLLAVCHVCSNAVRAVTKIKKMSQKKTTTIALFSSFYSSGNQQDSVPQFSTYDGFSPILNVGIRPKWSKGLKASMSPLNSASKFGIAGTETASRHRRHEREQASMRVAGAENGVKKFQTLLARNFYCRSGGGM